MNIPSLTLVHEFLGIVPKRPLFLAQKPLDTFLLKRIPEAKMARMLSEENMTLIRESRLKDITARGRVKTLEVDGLTLPARELGAGGTKETYEVIVNGKPTAFAICGTAGDAKSLTQKWLMTFNEVKNTKHIQRLGLRTNNSVSLYPVKINGYDFPALRMMPYSELPYKIIDGKTSRETFDEMLKGINDQKVLDSFEGIIEDLRMVVKNKLFMESDSINLCLDKGRFQLFLNDLTYPNLISLTTDNKKEATAYARYALSKYLKLFSSEERLSHSYLEKFLKKPHFDAIADKIASKILEGLD